MRRKSSSAVIGLVMAGTCCTAAIAADSVPATVDNFVRSEPALYCGGIVKDAGGISKFLHHRELIPIDQQPVIRSNRDTLYSGALFGLDAGPATITLPDAGGRFMSMQVIS